jgi:uncharacterized protein YbaR (Trm112 family)
MNESRSPDGAENEHGALWPEMLDLLACPMLRCRGALELTGQELRCRGCGRTYPLTQRWPVLLPGDAFAESPRGGDAHA